MVRLRVGGRLHPLAEVVGAGAMGAHPVAVAVDVVVALVVAFVVAGEVPGPVDRSRVPLGRLDGSAALL